MADIKELPGTDQSGFNRPSDALVAKNTARSSSSRTIEYY